MMERLLAKRDANQVEMKAMKHKMDVYRAKMDASKVWIVAKIDSQLKKMEDSLGKTEATYSEANPEEIESIALHEEVPKEEAVVETFGALKKRHGDGYPAVGRGQKPKKRIQSNGGSRKKLAATCRMMTLSVIAARRKGHGRQGQGSTRKPERTGIRGETSEETGRQQGNKEPRPKTAATPEEGDDNLQRHQRTKQETGATSWKREDIRQDLREKHRARVLEANSRIFHQDSKNEHQNIVECSVHSIIKVETTSESRDH
jgi:hypothetical protein